MIPPMGRRTIAHYTLATLAPPPSDRASCLRRRPQSPRPAQRACNSRSPCTERSRSLAPGRPWRPRLAYGTRPRARVRRIPTICDRGMLPRHRNGARVGDSPTRGGAMRRRGRRRTRGGKMALAVLRSPTERSQKGGVLHPHRGSDAPPRTAAHTRGKGGPRRPRRGHPPRARDLLALLFPDPQHRHERILGDFDAADSLQPPLAALLLLQQLLFTADVTPVTFRQDIFAHCLDIRP